MTNGFLSVKTDDLDLDTLVKDPATTNAGTPPQDPSSNKDSDADNTESGWKKRASDKDKYITKLKDELTTLKQEVEQLKKNPVQLPTTKEELEKFKTQYPELVNNIITLNRLEFAERDKDLDKRFKEIEQKSAEVEWRSKFEVVLKVHPDAGKIQNSQEFADWFHAQSQGTQALFESKDAKDWIRGINIYKEDTGIQVSRKQEAAAAVQTKSTPDTKIEGSKKVWKASEVQKLSDAHYNMYRDDIIKAKIEGRYTNDL